MRLAGSFQGLPKPDADRYPTDAGDSHWKFTQLTVSLDDVKRNFRRYDLFDSAEPGV
ncbi:MAG: TylF/MycF family methyltransferase [Candidatus Dormibacteraeota bacterium]|nr:TylF/MycF family methyltransferase [Candidatus Dormibacteraeota bacterium]